MKTVKDWYKSRTLWTAIIQFLIALGLVLQEQNPEIEVGGWALLIKSVWDILLRYRTNELVNVPRFLTFTK